MKQIDQPLENFSVQYPLTRFAPLEKILFMDIETTGFTARSSSLYLIGTAYFDGAKWHIRQWFSERKEEEVSLLHAFFTFARDYTHLVYFNGSQFDVPYLLQKCKQYNLAYDFDFLEQIDIFKRVSPYKLFLNTPSCKQKALETLLGISREDIYSGGELISVYEEYLSHPDEQALKYLLLHNADDMYGMLQLLPLLSFYDLFHDDLAICSVKCNPFKNYAGEQKLELLIQFMLPTKLPLSVSNYVNGCYFSTQDYEAALKVPLFDEEMKHFYKNYKDYYYLPAEDVALHKSVAVYTDKSHRIKASASNCYVKKKAVFLPLFDLPCEPLFQRDYPGKEYYCELTDERMQDNVFMSRYTTHVLNKMARFK